MQAGSQTQQPSLGPSSFPGQPSLDHNSKAKAENSQGPLDQPEMPATRMTTGNGECSNDKPASNAKVTRKRKLSLNCNSNKNEKPSITEPTSHAKDDKVSAQAPPASETPKKEEHAKQCPNCKKIFKSTLERHERQLVKFKPLCEVGYINHDPFLCPVTNCRRHKNTEDKYVSFAQK